VLLSPEMLGNFIRQHREAVLVCYNAAELHWLLEGHFRNDAESLDVLWAFSRESRLLDIMLLDQQFPAQRRFLTIGGPPRSRGRIEHRISW